MNSAILIGGLIGLMFGGWPGLFIGGLFGHFAGQALRGPAVSLRSGVQRIQAQFLESTFAVMGAVCKADGQVTADEIRVAETLFDRLRLSSDARRKAQAAFIRGKSPGFDLDSELARFMQAARGQRPLLQMFLQVQLSALTADGAIHPAEHEMLMRIARGLGLSAAEIQQLEAMLRGGAGATAGGRRAPSADQLADAYRVLGLDASASDAELKQSYRRLMSQNHPDKLAAKGLPESMREIAEQKTREITGAYERIQQARSAGARA